MLLELYELYKAGGGFVAHLGFNISNGLVLEPYGLWKDVVFSCEFIHSDNNDLVSKALFICQLACVELQPKLLTPLIGSYSKSHY